MRTFPKKASALALLATATLFACGGSDSDDDDDGEPKLSEFVLNQFDKTADDTEPVPINGKKLKIDGNPNAFDSLFD